MILVEEGFRGRPVLLSHESTGELGGNLDMFFVSRLLEDDLGILATLALATVELNRLTRSISSCLDHFLVDFILELISLARWDPNIGARFLVFCLFILIIDTDPTDRVQFIDNVHLGDGMSARLFSALQCRCSLPRMAYIFNWRLKV